MPENEPQPRSGRRSKPDGEASDILSRLDQWRTYVTAQVDSGLPFPDGERVDLPASPSVDPELAITAAPSDLPPSSAQSSSTLGQTGDGVDAVPAEVCLDTSTDYSANAPHDSIAGLAESYIADLKATIESEREHARAMAEAAARAQVLHAATLHRHMVDAGETMPPMPPSGVAVVSQGKPSQTRIRRSADVRAENRVLRIVAQVVVVIAFAAAGIGIVLYMLKG